MSDISTLSSNNNLQQYLRDWAKKDKTRSAVEETIIQLIEGTREIADISSLGSLAGDLANEAGTTNEDGDSQKMLDVKSHEILVEACANSPVAVLGSEESVEVIELNKTAPLAVVMDPLDGSSNIETNAPIGTIFSIYEMPSDENISAEEAVLQAGEDQLAAGYVIYGTQTALALTVGEGTHIFILDKSVGEYLLVRKNMQIPLLAKEYAINASNYDCWDSTIKNYVDDCILGYSSHKDRFNMRWVASLVAEAHRILYRGGVFLYPGDSRKGYENGRLRLVYEANAMAFLIEQAGGAATDCKHRIMEIKPESLHQRIPLIMGSIDHVSNILEYQTPKKDSNNPDAPLFGSIGLFGRNKGKY